MMKKTTQGLRRRFAANNRPASILFLLVGAFAFSSCSQDADIIAPEDPTETGQPITFNGQLPEPTAVSNARTRTINNLHDLSVNTFRVYGYKNDAYVANSYTSSQQVINGYAVRWEDGQSTTNTNGWEYLDENQTIKFWDLSAKAYRFFGFAPATAAVNANIESHTEGGKTIHDQMTLSMVVNADNEATTPYFSKLWFSTGNVIDYPDREFLHPVQILFLKPLSRARILFLYPEDSDLYDRSVLSDVNFAPITSGAKIAKQGTVRITYPLTGTDTTESWTSTPATKGSIEAFTEDYQAGVDEVWYNVLPTSTQGAYRMSVKVFDETRTAEVPAEFMVWQPGYEYTYVFKITSSGSLELDLLQMAVHNWTDITTAPQEVYNW